MRSWTWAGYEGRLSDKRACEATLAWPAYEACTHVMCVAKQATCMTYPNAPTVRPTPGAAFLPAHLRSHLFGVVLAGSSVEGAKRLASPGFGVQAIPQIGRVGVLSSATRSGPGRMTVACFARRVPSLCKVSEWKQHRKRHPLRVVGRGVALAFDHGGRFLSQFWGDFVAHAEKKRNKPPSKASYEFPHFMMTPPLL